MKKIAEIDIENVKELPNMQDFPQYTFVLSEDKLKVYEDQS